MSPETRKTFESLQSSSGLELPLWFCCLFGIFMVSGVLMLIWLKPFAIVMGVTFVIILACCFYNILYVLPENATKEAIKKNQP